MSDWAVVRQTVEDTEASIKATTTVLAEMEAQLARAQDNFMVTRGTLAVWKHALVFASSLVEQNMTQYVMIAQAMRGLEEVEVMPDQVPG